MAGDERLLGRMRASKSGWGQKDFEALYVSFGFAYKEGARHRLYFHPKYRELYATVARHNNLAKGYASTAVRLIDRLIELEAANE